MQSAIDLPPLMSTAQLNEHSKPWAPQCAVYFTLILSTNGLELSPAVIEPTVPAVAEYCPDRKPPFFGC
jgi:hypothetical protein